ncbi:MAG: two-component regulator propeller domain-containing protein, partial [Verrucomicrobiales bacterium]|nr:two-component regulator propeller domain-containing protein [Verrucomicrobiales bacterium]
MLCLSAVLPFQGIAQETDASQIRFTHYNEELDLSSNEVSDIILDRSGWIWMATRDGLNQFDAHETRVHRHNPDVNDTLSSNNLTCLTLGADGKIWVGTAGHGLNLFDPETETSQRFIASINRTDTNHLPSGTISDLAISENRFLWVGTDKGLAVMDLPTGKIRQVEGDLGISRISCISVFDEKTVWVGTAKGEVYVWDDNGSQFNIKYRRNTPITAIGRDIHLNVWIGTEGSGLYRTVNGSELERIESDIRDVSAIWSDSNGDLWIGTTRGLAKLNRGEKTFRVFRSVKGEEHSLCHDNVTSVFEDRSRNMLWIGTKGGGTSRFRLDRYWFPHIRYNGNGTGLPHPSIWSMTQSTEEGMVWIGTERGVAMWDGNNQSIIRDIPGVSDCGAPYAISLLEDSVGNLWIGTKGEGLIKVDSDKKVTRFAADYEQEGQLG